MSSGVGEYLGSVSSIVIGALEVGDYAVAKIVLRKENFSTL